MSAYAAGIRVIISFGVHQGRRGVIAESRDEMGVAVVYVRLEGSDELIPFRASVLMRERST